MPDSVVFNYTPDVDPAPEKPKRTRKKPASSEDVSALLASDVIQQVEDTTPIVWDGSIPVAPKDWMQYHSWTLITSLEALKSWWEAVKADTVNHVPNAQEQAEGSLLRHPKIGFDLETTGLDNRVVLGQCRTEIVGICLSSYLPGGSIYHEVKAPDYEDTLLVGLKQCCGIYIPIAHKRWPYNLTLEEVLPVLAEIFQTSIIVTHNGKFDFGSLKAAGTLTTREVQYSTFVEKLYERKTIELPKYPMLEDTQALMFMIDCDRTTRGGYGLKGMALEFLGQEMLEFEEMTSSGAVKKGRKKVLVTFDCVEPFKALHYAAADAICTLQLSDVLGFVKQRNPFIHQVDTNIVSFQQWCEEQRPLIDREFLNDQDRFLELKCAHALSQIQAICGFAINPDSTKILGKTLFEDMNLPNKGKTAPSRLFPGGNWKTDAETMEALAREHPQHAIFKLIVSYRELRSAYPKKLFDNTEPLDNSAKVSYSATRTPSGRFACSGGEYIKDGGCGVNVQALQALYAAKYTEVLALDTLALQGVDGLASTSMFDPSLKGWLDTHVRVVNPVDYPDKDEIRKSLKDQGTPEGELEGAIKQAIQGQLEVYKNAGQPVLREGIKLANLKNNPTVSGQHLKLTPDGWVCMLVDCPECLANIPCTRTPLAYDVNEVINIRRSFIAPPGWTFFSIDYSALELRMVANMARETLWIEGFVGGKDLHGSMAEACFKDKFRTADPETRSYLRSMAKCVKGDTLVWTTTGMQSIESFWPEEVPKIIDTACRIPVIQLPNEDRIVDCDTVYYNGVKPTKRVTLSDGNQLEGTLVHPVRTISATGKYAWTTLENLRVGDLVCCRLQRHPGTTPLPISLKSIPLLQTSPATLTPELALWLGLLTGDGSQTIARPRLCFVSSEKDVEMHQCFRDLSLNLFGIRPREYSEISVRRFEINNKALIEWLEMNQLTFRTVEKQKFCPEPVLMAGPAAWKGFLAGLFATDGHVMQGGNGGGLCMIATIYPQLAQSTLHMLQGLGSDPYIRCYPSKMQKHPLFVIKFSANLEDVLSMNPLTRKTEAWQARHQARVRKITKRRGDYAGIKTWIDRCITNVSPSIKRARKAWYPETLKLGWHGGGQQVQPAYTDEQAAWFMQFVLPCKVVSIEDSEAEVYDLVVPDGHTFITNGVLSHNTVTFACLYGGSSKTVQQNLSDAFSADEAKELYANWIGAIPNYKAWVDRQKYFVKNYQCIVTAFNRRRSVVRDVSSGDPAKLAYAERTGLNHPSQGTAADILRIALIRIQEWLFANNLQDYVRIHFHVHDEIDLSCKDEWVPFIIPNIVRIMKVHDAISWLQWPVPLECDVEYGKSWDVKHNFGKKDKCWSGIPSLKAMDQGYFKNLYKLIVDGGSVGVADYKSQVLPIIYAYWNSIGYHDPYQAFVEERQARAEAFQRFRQTSMEWPLPAQLV